MRNTAIVAYNSVDGADYKGLAIANNGTANFLYAADFRNRKIDVFDKNFVKVTASGGFTDPTLPAGFAPYNIQALSLAGTTVLVVTYAKQDGTGHVEIPGAGEGLVNTFDLNGTLLKHLVPRGAQLNAPWGVAVAPANFGTLSNALLVGNFGDGRINGFDATTGAFIHAISNASGAPIANSGLWGLWFGNGGRNQPTNVLYIAAGINGEVNGLYARIDLGATAPDIAAPTGVAVTAPAAASTVSGSVTVTANATDNVGVARVVFSVRVGTTTTEIATDTSAPYSATWNTGAVANGAATLTAAAFDAYGNSTTSANVAVTVNNVADTTPPTVSITAPTGGDVTGTVTLTATAADNVGVSQVQFLAGTTVIGTATSAPYTVQWNTAGLSGIQQLTAVARDGANNTTTSTAVAVTVVNAPSLGDLQSSIFGAVCSSCHSGAGATLPGVMNLSSRASTYAALVGVTSLEVPGLKRVTAGEPNNSYVIHKVEGHAVSRFEDAAGRTLPLADRNQPDPRVDPGGCRALTSGSTCGDGRSGRQSDHRLDFDQHLRQRQAGHGYQRRSRVVRPELHPLRCLHDAQLLHVVIHDEHGDLRHMLRGGANRRERETHVAKGTGGLDGEVRRERPIGVVAALA